MGEGHNRLLKLKEKEDDGSSRRFVLRFDEFSKHCFPVGNLARIITAATVVIQHVF